MALLAPGLIRYTYDMKEVTVMEPWMMLAVYKILLPVVVCMVLTSLLMLATEREKGGRK